MNNTPSPQEKFEIPNIPFNSHTFFILPTDEDEVRLTINGLKEKSDGGDEIHAN